MSNEDLELTRREFLRAGGSVFTLSLVMGTGFASYSTPAAAALAALSGAQARTLMAMERTLFPHDWLPDSYYQAVVQSVDAKMAADAKTLDLVTAGVKRLDTTSVKPFVELA